MTLNSTFCYLSKHIFSSQGYICHNTEIQTWVAHREIAKASPGGGDLVTIHCEEQNSKFKSLVGDNRAWIGLHDKNTEDTWEWVDGTPVLYTNWATNEPNDYYYGEDCVELIYSGTLWNDQVCNDPRGGIYESTTDLTNNSGITCIEYVGK